MSAERTRAERNDPNDPKSRASLDAQQAAEMTPAKIILGAADFYRFKCAVVDAELAAVLAKQAVETMQAGRAATRVIHEELAAKYPGLSVDRAYAFDPKTLELVPQ